MSPSKSIATLSNIEIAQHAKMKPIVPLAVERLGIPETELQPFGHYKAKISLDYCTHLDKRKNGKLDPGHGHLPHSGRGRQDHHDGRPWRCAQSHRQEVDHLPARAGPRPGLRHEGRRRRWWLCAGRAHGGHQPPLHGRLLRHRTREQPARGDDRQPHLSRQRGGLRRAPRSPGAASSMSTIVRSATLRSGSAAPAMAIRDRMASTSWSPPKSWRSSAWRRASRTSRSGSAGSSSATRASTSQFSRRTSRRTAQWRRSSRTRSRRTWCRRSRIIRLSSMAARSRTSRMAAIQ